jgi:hypothetical protein
LQLGLFRGKIISTNQNLEANTTVEFKKTEKNGIVCAVVVADTPVITDAQTALDLLMTAKYDIGTKNIVIDKKLIAEDFFILSTGLAGEILQKFINYGGRIAIYGDYSRYTSKPLKDFIYESNKGKDVFFVSTEEEAIDMMTR